MLFVECGKKILAMCETVSDGKDSPFPLLLFVVALISKKVNKRKRGR